jgi:hypothetical protein
MRVRALAVAGLSAVLLAACGGGSSDDTATNASSAAASSSQAAPHGPELAAASADALEQAGSVRMQGQAPLDGEVGNVDLRLQGPDVAGSMGVGGQTVQIVVTGGSLYMQATPEFWAAQGMPEQMADSFADTWVLAPADAAGGLGDFSLAGFVSELRSPSDSTVEDEVEADEVDGQRVWVVHNSDGSLLHVAAEGKPYPLSITKTGTDGGTLIFSDFGVTTPITAPAHYLDFSDLGS